MYYYKQGQNSIKSAIKLSNNELDKISRIIKEEPKRNVSEKIFDMLRVDNVTVKTSQHHHDGLAISIKKCWE